VAQDIFIPKLGMTMEEATIAEWTAADGDRVEKNQIILVIDTEKVAHEMESPASGFLVILADSGEIHPCGAVVGKLAETKEEYEGIKKSGMTVEVKSVEVTELEQEKTAEGEPAAEASTGPVPKTSGRIEISPVAKRIAEINEIDYSHLAGTGSGPGGRIVKKDILEAMETEQAVEVSTAEPALVIAASAEEYNGKRIKESIPLKGMRKIIAERMHQSATVAAHVTVMSEQDMTEMISLRKYYSEKAAASGAKITFTDMFILIVSKALKAAPIINSSLIGDEIKIWEDINIGFAVSMKVSEKESGLVVPVIKNADRKGLVEISRERKDLMDKARQGNLAMDEMSGATFTLTNTGPILNTWHVQTPIINQPESAILGTSSIVEKPVVKDGEIVISPIMPMSFSFDHRVVDGGPVAVFMAKLDELIQDPKMLLL
jgi:pyruvate/2-oxoglutarate dehydrogenase complex dihydrolipoamide acyltransferase (E2) component